jgi:hypothetical protein
MVDPLSWNTYITIDLVVLWSWNQFTFTQFFSLISPTNVNMNSKSTTSQFYFLNPSYNLHMWILWVNYCNLRSISTLTNIYIYIYISFRILKLLNFFMIYYDFFTWIMKLFKVQPMIIITIFNMSYFHKIAFHYYEDYLMTKMTLR